MTLPVKVTLDVAQIALGLHIAVMPDGKPWLGVLMMVIGLGNLFTDLEVRR